MTNIIVIILVGVLLITSILLFFHKEIWKETEKKNYRKRVYKELYHYAQENDQLLINNCMVLFPGEQEATKIDHILMADKYVYVVKDVYYDGALYGNLNDEKLLNQTTEGTVNIVENPITANARTISKLEKMTSIEHENSIFVNVCCTNKSLLLQDGMKIKEFGLFFLPTNELSSTIAAAEKDKIDPIGHNKTEKLINLLKERSDLIKEEYRSKGRKI